MPRSVLTFPGSKSVPGAQKLDVTPNEIYVANIPSLKMWPGLFEWDVASGTILDRVTDKVIPSYGVSLPSANFATMINGKRGYKINALAQTLMGDFNTTGSFTVGGVFDLHSTFGSYTETAANNSVPAAWGLYSNAGGSGLISAFFGTIAVAETVSANWPIKLAANRLTAIVIVFDRTLGEISIRYNGIQMWKSTPAQAETVKGISLLNEIIMGAVRVYGVGRDLVPRVFTTNAFAAFESALVGDDLTAFENLLLQAAASA